MNTRTDVLVLGGGPAGTTAAISAARSGRSVTLVTDGHIGGRTMHASLVPSKALLHLASLRAARGDKALLTPDEVVQFGEDVERLVSHQAARTAERLIDSGVRVIAATARFASEDSVEVTHGVERDTITFDRAIIATGSNPHFPEKFFGEQVGPDGDAIFAPRHVRWLRSLPETLLVVGGGVTGAEACSAFLDLGVRVTWVMDDVGMLRHFDRELASSLGDVLMERGAKLVHGKRVTSVTRSPHADAPKDERVLATLDGGRTYAAERAFVAIGRRPDVARLRPEQARVELDPKRGGVVVDGFGRSSNPRVYAAGDAAGAPFTANKASAEAWIAGRHATDQPTEARHPEAYVEAVFTRPELARVGVSPEEAMRRALPFEVRVASYESSVRGVLAGAGFDHHARGTVKVVLDVEGRVLGATAIGPGASEVLAPLAVAIHLGARADALTTLFLAEPSLTSLALEALR